MTIEVGTEVGFQMDGHEDLVQNAVAGTITGSSEIIHLTNIYGPHDISSKAALWNDLETVIDPSVPHLIIGDFNEVRHREDRLNSVFCQSDANRFNSFIRRSGLKEFNLGGRKYTFMSKTGDKFSRIDRAIATPAFLRLWSGASLVALPRELSDHCPLLLRSNSPDFGAIPFRYFSSWSKKPGYLEIVNQGLSYQSSEDKPDKALALKLKNVKNRLKSWIKSEKDKEEYELKLNRDLVDGLDLKAESIGLTPAEIQLKCDALKKIKELNLTKNEELKQKARIQWTIDGDENSKYFHGLIRCRTTKNRILGFRSEGQWISDPPNMKSATHKFFQSKFKEPNSAREMGNKFE
ncbi:hypothetical protein SSX86_016813 [Deinandra increscens subsp. villosa]|uniref:Endonuclease/exonuclease/phosphatase domain-containing protein n=1 Tax=Deinandra increscens subsp. villosa TaxID=3103831 RepID=A0AAP0H0G2_9ASTR